VPCLQLQPAACYYLKPVNKRHRAKTSAEQIDRSSPIIDRALLGAIVGANAGADLDARAYAAGGAVCGTVGTATAAALLVLQTVPGGSGGGGTRAASGATTASAGGGGGAALFISNCASCSRVAIPLEQLGVLLSAGQGVVPAQGLEQAQARGQGRRAVPVLVQPQPRAGFSLLQALRGGGGSIAGDRNAAAAAAAA